MKNLASLSSHRPLAHSLTLGLALTLSALGCGGSSDVSEAADDTSAEGTTEGLDSDTVSTNNSGQPSAQLPLDPNADSGNAAGSMLDPRELVEGDQCDSGWLQSEADPERECAATYGGLCFESNDNACTCAGCAEDACLILESYPTQIRCESVSLESL